MLPLTAVVDEAGQPVDPMTAATALLQQQVLTAELERINSLLCGPCGCTLCCTGPEADMTQEFFEIPLAPQELDLFPVPRHDSDASRGRRATDEEELIVEGVPFYRLAGPRLVHWRNGWSMILPRQAGCPGLDPASGYCRVYAGAAPGLPPAAAFSLCGGVRWTKAAKPAGFASPSWPSPTALMSGTCATRLPTMRPPAG